MLIAARLLAVVSRCVHHLLGCLAKGKRHVVLMRRVPRIGVQAVVDGAITGQRAGRLDLVALLDVGARLLEVLSHWVQLSDAHCTFAFILSVQLSPTRCH